MRIYTYLIILIVFSACTKMKNVDLIIYNTTVITVDNNFSTTECIAVKDGKIVATGSNDFILSNYNSENKYDLKGKFVYPGFIDAHCHFYGYGTDLQWTALEGSKSFNEILSKLEIFYKNLKSNFISG